MRKTVSRSIGWIFLAPLFVGIAAATSMVYMDLDRLASAATVIVRARCVGAQGQIEGGEIWTISQFESVESLKGMPPSQITVRLIGGRAGHLVSTVDGVPRFRVGEEVVLFLEPVRTGEWSVTSWVQGTFRIRRDPQTRKENVSQDTSSVSMFDPATRQFRPGGIRNLPWEEFRQRVRDAVVRQEKAK